MASTSQQNTLSFKPEVNERHVLQLRQAFDLLDTDGTRSINVRELKVLLRAFGFAPPKEELVSIISETDKEGAGKIHFSKFLNLITQKRSDEDTKEEILRTFQLFDDDETGTILADTVLKCMAEELGKNITDDALQEMNGKGDQEGEGEVSQ